MEERKRFKRRQPLAPPILTEQEQLAVDMEKLRNLSLLKTDTEIDKQEPNYRREPESEYISHRTSLNYKQLALPSAPSSLSYQHSVKALPHSGSAFDMLI